MADNDVDFQFFVDVSPQSLGHHLVYHRGSVRVTAKVAAVTAYEIVNAMPGTRPGLVQQAFGSKWNDIPLADRSVVLDLVNPQVSASVALFG